jgi:hypothetical protein
LEEDNDLKPMREEKWFKDFIEKVRESEKS